MTRDQIKKMLDAYLDAEIQILEGKSITFNGQTMTMENLSEVRKGREYWERRYIQACNAQRGSKGFKVARFE
ncbi:MULTISPECIES: hypothetical protein [Providencia]|uniref:hypothetical protein n=1 Tax=Providencia TaxID=586 RepID=UPI001B38F507|nr:MULTISPECIES: hypothetical protein [Providencia]MBQ0314312.1 hypothetical protein [Providencia rettgeri]MBQ0323877.1 hypothetical protein [Providencia rettgeri]MBQ0349495.1 hypothetical protein [Providencia rettgeri]